MPKRVFITVAEVSGDQHAAVLARALWQLDPSMVIEGHGGSAMSAAGVVIHHETVNRATMFIRAALRAVEIWKLLRWTKHYYRQSKPDLHICIDSSGMNLHLAKMARSCGVPVLYYISPQLWASRAGRITQVRQFVNRVACILPFEEPYYRQRGVAATFVGHPLFDQLLPDRQLSPEPVTAFTPVGSATEYKDESQMPGWHGPVLMPVSPSKPNTTGMSTCPCHPVKETSDFHDGIENLSSPVIGLMPGSRRAEIRGNWPHMLEVADRIRAAFPQARFEVSTTPPTHALVCELAAGRNDMRIEQGAIDAMAPGWDFCIAKSGTTTLHVAAYAVPMIVVFRASKWVWHLAARWLIKTPSIALVNILAERSAPESGIPKHRIVPEIIPWNGPNAPVAELAIDFLRHPEKRKAQRNDLLKLVATLDRQGASQRVAEIAMEMMNPPNH